MDVFGFFVSRDMDLEAIILAEKEPTIVTERVRVNADVDVINEEVKATDADEMMEDVTLHYLNLFILKQKCSIWIANSPILRMCGMNSFSSIIVTLTSP